MKRNAAMWILPFMYVMVWILIFIGKLVQLPLIALSSLIRRLEAFIYSDEITK